MCEIIMLRNLISFNNMKKNNCFKQINQLSKAFFKTRFNRVWRIFANVWMRNVGRKNSF